MRKHGNEKQGMRMVTERESRKAGVREREARAQGTGTRLLAQSVREVIKEGNPHPHE
jgi:hypothetical protein